MKQIPLTQGQVALVDDDDFEYLNQHKWYAHKRHGIYYAIRNVYLENGKRSAIKMHRFIMNMQPSDKTMIDHIDRNGLNNQKHNLRKCTNQENRRNSIKQSKKSTSIYKGVVMHTHKQFNKKKQQIVYYRSWHARIVINGKRKVIGCFKTEDEAAIAYNQAAISHYGEFALLNKI